MDYMIELAAIAKSHGGIIETKTAAGHGISKAMLYNLCNRSCEVCVGIPRLPGLTKDCLCRL